MKIDLKNAFYAMVVAGLFANLGCNPGQAPSAKTGSGSEVSKVEGKHEHDSEEGGHNLHGFWCVEHGVPEKICGQCHPDVAAEFQKKGDWCEEHKRPDSQCFIHHPELRDKFIAQYEAKFGEKPPASEE